MSNIIKSVLCVVSSVALLLLNDGQIYAQFPGSQPARVLHDDLSIRPLAEAPFEAVKLAYNKSDGFLYVIARNGNLHRLNPETGVMTGVQNASHHGMSDTQGLAISDEGVFYLVGNSTDRNVTRTNTAFVKRATINGNRWQWETVMQTEPIPLSNTDFDHMINEVVISPDGQHLYINSGSRTDHGEVQSAGGLYPGLRESPLTGKILKIPTDATDLLLLNDSDFLWNGGYIHVDGIRNSFGLAFNADGELFGSDNAGERDDPEELNWLKAGFHYGFPWYAGGNTNPMQFDGYDPSQDLLLTTDTRSEIFYNDPDFPPPPDTLVFKSPILNHGPDAVMYRDPETGQIRNAAEEQIGLTSFTGHRSLLGLQFDADSSFGAPYTGDAFILSFTGGNDMPFLLQHMDDDGEDLLHLRLVKVDDDTYEMTSTKIADRFLNPIDSEIIGNKLFVMEFKTTWLNSFATTRIWEITFPLNSPDTSLEPGEIVQSFQLYQNYPNPFNPITQINYSLDTSTGVMLEVFDSMGRIVDVLVDGVQSAGHHSVAFNAANLPSGLYLYRLSLPGQNNFNQTKKMMLVK